MIILSRGYFSDSARALIEQCPKDKKVTHEATCPETAIRLKFEWERKKGLKLSLSDGKLGSTAVVIPNVSPQNADQIASLVVDGIKMQLS